jgi:Fur family ferric uptake transcriptional regulator
VPGSEESAGRPVAGTRPTRQRKAVSGALSEVDDFRSAQEIHDLLKQRGERVGLTTVYRTLQALADSGAVDVLRTPEGESAYRRCSRGHHHHLVCRGCGRTVEVEGPTVELWADRIAADHGFVDVSHTLEIFGTCPDCAGGARRGELSAK